MQPPIEWVLEDISLGIERPGRQRSAGTHWIGGWMGPRAVLDAVVRRKTPTPYRDSNLEVRGFNIFQESSDFVQSYIN
jgi:hypothetical protein